MAFSHGTSAVLKLDNSGGSLTDISAYVTGVDFQRVADALETTVLNLTSKTFIAGLKDASFSVEGNWDPTVDAIIDAALGTATTRTFEYSPQGTAASSIKYSGECICTSYPIPASVDGVLKFSAEFQVTGAVTRGTN